jgi:hypothetical protein
MYLKRTTREEGARFVGDRRRGLLTRWCLCLGGSGSCDCAQDDREGVRGKATKTHAGFEMTGRGVQGKATKTHAGFETMGPLPGAAGARAGLPRACLPIQRTFRSASP